MAGVTPAMPRKKKTASQPYELFVFARRHSIPVEVARRILELHGIDRVASDLAAQQVVRSGANDNESSLDT